MRAFRSVETEADFVLETVVPEYLGKKRKVSVKTPESHPLWRKQQAWPSVSEKGSVVLWDAVKGVLFPMEQDGRMDELIQKWFGTVNQ